MIVLTRGVADYHNVHTEWKLATCVVLHMVMGLR